MEYERQTYLKYEPYDRGPERTDQANGFYYGWLRRKYLSVGNTFGFAARIRASTGEIKVLRLYSIAKTVIERHIKVRGETNPHDP